MAAVRWAKDRARRSELAKLTAEQYPNRIVRRIIVIDGEKEVREAVIHLKHRHFNFSGIGAAEAEGGEMIGQNYFQFALDSVTSCAYRLTQL